MDPLVFLSIYSASHIYSTACIKAHELATYQWFHVIGLTMHSTIWIPDEIYKLVIQIIINTLIVGGPYTYGICDFYHTYKIAILGISKISMSDLFALSDNDQIVHFDIVSPSRFYDDILLAITFKIAI